MPYLPLFVRPESLRILVVGSGPVGSARARKLKSLGAKVTVVSLTDSPELRKDGIEVIVADALKLEAPFYSQFHFVIASTGKEEVNEAICEKVREAGRLCDNPLDRQGTDFILPIFTANDVFEIAVTSYGASTQFAKEVMERVMEILNDPKLLNLGKASSLLKPLVKSYVSDPKLRVKLYHEIYNDTKFRELAEKGDIEGAKKRAVEVIKSVTQ